MSGFCDSSSDRISSHELHVRVDDISLFICEVLIPLFLFVRDLAEFMNDVHGLFDNDNDV